jgi:hypothetical protein
MSRIRRRVWRERHHVVLKRRIGVREHCQADRSVVTVRVREDCDRLVFQVNGSDVQSPRYGDRDLTDTARDAGIPPRDVSKMQAFRENCADHG